MWRPWMGIGRLEEDWECVFLSPLVSHLTLGFSQSTTSSWFMMIELSLLAFYMYVSILPSISSKWSNVVWRICPRGNVVKPHSIQVSTFLNFFFFQPACTFTN